MYCKYRSSVLAKIENEAGGTHWVIPRKTLQDYRNGLVLSPHQNKERFDLYSAMFKIAMKCNIYDMTNRECIQQHLNLNEK